MIAIDASYILYKHLLHPIKEETVIKALLIDGKCLRNIMASFSFGSVRQPQTTAAALVGRNNGRDPTEFGTLTHAVGGQHLDTGPRITGEFSKKN